MQENLSLLSQLIQVSHADGQLDEMEYRLILAMGALLGISRVQVEELLYAPVDVKLQASEFDRIQQFYRILLLVNVNNKVHEEELVTLRKCGLRMGLRPEAVEEVLKEMPRHKNGQLPPEMLMRIFQRYHN